MTVLSLAAGGGTGFWLGRNAHFPDLQKNAAAAFQHRSATPDLTAEAVDTDAPEVDAITARLGDVQAELQRLDALGGRLVEMSGLKILSIMEN